MMLTVGAMMVVMMRAWQYADVQSILTDICCLMPFTHVECTHSLTHPESLKRT